MTPMDVSRSQVPVNNNPIPGCHAVMPPYEFDSGIHKHHGPSQSQAPPGSGNPLFEGGPGNVGTSRKAVGVGMPPGLAIRGNNLGHPNNGIPLICHGIPIPGGEFRDSPVPHPHSVPHSLSHSHPHPVPHSQMNMNIHGPSYNTLHNQPYPHSLHPSQTQGGGGIIHARPGILPPHAANNRNLNGVNVNGGGIISDPNNLAAPHPLSHSHSGGIGVGYGVLPPPHLGVGLGSGDPSIDHSMLNNNPYNSSSSHIPTPHVHTEFDKASNGGGYSIHRPIHFNPSSTTHSSYLYNHPSSFGLNYRKVMTESEKRMRDRERNRVHAKKSRQRKKEAIKSLVDEICMLEDARDGIRRWIKSRIDNTNAASVLCSIYISFSNSRSSSQSSSSQNKRDHTTINNDNNNNSNSNSNNTTSSTKSSQLEENHQFSVVDIDVWDTIFQSAKKEFTTNDLDLLRTLLSSKELPKWLNVSQEAEERDKEKEKDREIKEEELSGKASSESQESMNAIANPPLSKKFVDMTPADVASRRKVINKFHAKQTRERKKKVESTAKNHKAMLDLHMVLLKTFEEFVRRTINEKFVHLSLSCYSIDNRTDNCNDNSMTTNSNYSANSASDSNERRSRQKSKKRSRNSNSSKNNSSNNDNTNVKKSSDSGSCEEGTTAEHPTSSVSKTSSNSSDCSNNYINSDTRSEEDDNNISTCSDDGFNSGSNSSTSNQDQTTTNGNNSSVNNVQRSSNGHHHLNKKSKNANKRQAPSKNITVNNVGSVSSQSSDTRNGGGSDCSEESSSKSSKLNYMSDEDDMDDMNS